ncbi:protein IQ-DOMAIN 12-like [Solanum dulcamara]|uniref:protein IQ-DOMAIN 12-like n=1 Tax=Solanum dulcamara TaxID=45834 RepID=UPI002484F16C|nr:protein IQ-DOMAIN 12-like [Solanum dulcamara]
MGKRRNWFTFVKRLSIPETEPIADQKKPKRWKCCFLKNFKLRKCPAITSATQQTLTEAKEQQRKHAFATAANAAADVILLTNAPNEFKRKHKQAAIKIQSAYRAHLAKKALSAIKGLVKLQAVIRGEIVRRRLIAKLKFMLPLHQKPNTRVCQIKLPTLEDYHDNNDKKLINSPREIMKSKELKLKCKSLRASNFNLASEQDSEALWSRREKAIKK